MLSMRAWSSGRLHYHGRSCIGLALQPDGAFFRPEIISAIPSIAKIITMNQVFIYQIIVTVGVYYPCVCKDFLMPRANHLILKP